LANYVKFRRGLISDFEKLPLESREPDTLYFIYNKDDDSAELYLGSRKISGDGATSIGSISDLKDIVLTEIQNSDLLVYDNISQKWVNKSVDEIFSDFVATTEATVVSIENINNNTHQDLIDQEFAMTDPVVGDIIIIKDIIASDKYQYTGYVYNGENWAAMDGNYNAENIYFDEDFIFTEDIGTITIPEAGNITVAAAGKNLKEFLSTVFTKEENPIITSPSATIKLNPITNLYEVGTEYTPQYSIVFDAGSYSYGPTPTGVTATYIVTDTIGNNTLNTFSGTFDTITINDDTAYSINAEVAYSDGAIPKTNLQNDYPDGQIKAGVLPTLTTTVVKGYRNFFYGTLPDKSELNSDIIRSLTGKTTNKTFSINVPVGAHRVLFAFPKVSDNDDFKSAKNVNAMNSESKVRFQKQIIPVAGANGYAPIDYNVFVLDYIDPATATNVYDIII
jgi:hypothetical protein